jgi:predicted RNA-binding Zn-ribbon protein involved in translation (DUF1610 family)
MVRVVDPGPAPEVVKQAICRSCGARLEYVPNDVKTYNGKDYSGGSDGQDWIDCPQCSKRVILRSW